MRDRHRTDPRLLSTGSVPPPAPPASARRDLGSRLSLRAARSRSKTPTASIGDALVPACLRLVCASSSNVQIDRAMDVCAQSRPNMSRTLSMSIVPRTHDFIAEELYKRRLRYQYLCDFVPGSPILLIRSRCRGNRAFATMKPTVAASRCSLPHRRRQHVRVDLLLTVRIRTL